VAFTIYSRHCLIDNIKLERGATVTAYSDYAAASSRSLVYEKLLPDYLAAGDGGVQDGIRGACYELDGGSYRLKNDAPAQCSNFARRCTRDEAGCELYTAVEKNVKVPAKVAAQDYCPAQCLGYDTFVQGQTNFDSARPAYFIPKTARVCSAETAGCDQFTNLDEVKKGGEGTEYYTYLRQCLKKTGNEQSCGDFYNWEGSDESGFQLKVESLELNGDQPAVTGTAADSCDEAAYNLRPGQPGYTADCRQFINKKGELSYHLYSRTISCADDCHPFRRTEINELTVADCQSGCPVGDNACLTSCNPPDTDNCLTVKLADNKNSKTKIFKLKFFIFPSDNLNILFIWENSIS